MPRGKKNLPKITDFLGLKWEEQKPEEPASDFNCNFCNKAIYLTEEWFMGITPDGLDVPGDQVATACKDCVTAAGIKW